MEFLNPAWLWALPLGLLPVWFHLKRLKSAETEAWAATLFLPKNETKTKVSPKLQHLILLIIRVLLIILTIILLAKPSIKTQSGSNKLVFVEPNSLITQSKIEEIQFNEKVDEVLEFGADYKPLREKKSTFRSVSDMQAVINDIILKYPISQLNMVFYLNKPYFKSKQEILFIPKKSKIVWQTKLTPKTIWKSKNQYYDALGKTVLNNTKPHVVVLYKDTVKINLKNYLKSEQLILEKALESIVETKGFPIKINDSGFPIPNLKVTDELNSVDYLDLNPENLPIKMGTLVTDLEKLILDKIGLNYKHLSENEVNIKTYSSNLNNPEEKNFKNFFWLGILLLLLLERTLSLYFIK